MLKRQTLILGIISVLTLMVFAVSATFAFLTTRQHDIGNTSINASTNAATSIFITDIDGNLVLDFEEDPFTAGETSYIESNATYRTIFYSSASNFTSKCTFDIIYTWDKDSSEYNRTNDDNEFTIQATSNFTNKTDAPDISETNLNIDETWQSKIIYDEFNNSNEVYYKVLAKDVTITNIDNTSPTILNYDFHLRFYNIAANQNELLGKTFIGTVSVDNLNCNSN